MEQDQRFATAGFVVEKALLTSNVERLAEQFDRIIRAKPLLLHQSGRKTAKCLPREIECLSTDLRIPELEAYVSELLVSKSSLLSCDANLLIGDSFWHTDAPSPVPNVVKVAAYLDDLRDGQGALAFIPGSHRNLSHSHEVRPMTRCGTELRAPVPRVAATAPGDVIIFDLSVLHGAFGARIPRRQFSLLFCAPLQRGQDPKPFRELLLRERALL